LAHFRNARPLIAPTEPDAGLAVFDAIPARSPGAVSMPALSAAPLPDAAPAATASTRIKLFRKQRLAAVELASHFVRYATYHRNRENP
jgi:hypothetical protein